MIEIERKFLVKFPEKAIAQAHKSFPIFQGYISDDPARTVRLRISNKQGFITIKGPSSTDGTTRQEWEKQIDLTEAGALKTLCLPGTIQKIRYLVSFGSHQFEVDVFEGVLKGLVLAEAELEHHHEPVVTPPWIGKEVTGDKRYYNSYLAKHGMP